MWNILRLYDVSPVHLICSGVEFNCEHGGICCEGVGVVQLRENTKFSTYCKGKTGTNRHTFGSSFVSWMFPVRMMISTPPLRLMCLWTPAVTAPTCLQVSLLISHSVRSKVWTPFNIQCIFLIKLVHVQFNSWMDFISGWGKEETGYSACVGKTVYYSLDKKILEYVQDKCISILITFINMFT